MEKTYNPSDWELDIYNNWLEEKVFASKPNKNKKKFSIVMPPPNVTGQLHMGHALNNTIQDIIIRHKRMQGYEAMWLPGADHAAIATEAKIVEAMASEGVTKEQIGREKFLERADAWYKKFGDRIVCQLKRLGVSCDFDRFSFTMDENLSAAVKHVFVEYYNKGLIYKGKRIVNWCPHCKTSISDTENVYKDQETSLWHIKYPLVDGSGFLTVATTRPETLFGDSAVAVNPNDERYKNFVGKDVILPLCNRTIKVIADEYCEMGFGTGAVKITPAHDPNDYDIGLRHNLEIISCILDDGKLNENAGKFCGLDRIEARPKIIEELKKQGYLLKIEKYKNKVGCCDRCKSITEPKISTQWFVKMEDLAKPAIEVCKQNKLKFVPKRFEKNYFNWLENIRDWCISRQLWLGHRLPVYYCNDCGNTMVSEQDVKVCTKCGSHSIKQEEDVLDTWFSSALWPFSTLGYPKITEDLKYYYPTNVLVTGYDIIPFWVTKMVFSGLEFMKETPFEYCCINGIVRDSQGRKMSKSLNNGIDPIEVIEKYGADATRLSLVINTSMGNDISYSYDKVESAKNFINKLWNASKFVLTTCENTSYEQDIYKLNLSTLDKWILCEFNNLTKQVNKKLDKFEQGVASNLIYEFVWNKFCDFYIEASKLDLYSENLENKTKTQKVLVYVLNGILKLLHPFTPFVTEKIYLELNNKSVVREEYPKYTSKLNFENEKVIFEKIIDTIKNVRNTRSSLNVKDNVRTSMYILPIKNNEEIKDCLNIIGKLAGAKTINLIEKEIEGKYTKIVNEICIVYIPSDELFDNEKEKERLNKELESINFEINRSEKMLGNVNFVNKAPKALIEKEKEKLKNNIKTKEKILESINNL